MTNADIILRVRAAKGQLDAIARDSGVPLKTLHKIHYGSTSNPRMDTLDKLRVHFQRDETRQ